MNKYMTHTPTGQDIVIWLSLFGMVFLVPVLGRLYSGQDHAVWLIVISVILGFFLFNLALRKWLLLKTYFTSPFNLLTAKTKAEQVYEISIDLMFDKIIEVIHDSKFKLARAEKSKYTVLATTGISWKSWGENIYIDLEESGEGTLMKFCSVTFFQLHSWGKNRKNCDDLLEAIDQSLTI
jgi:hypothetical protein